MITRQRAILVLAIVIVFTAVVAYLLVVRDTDNGGYDPINTNGHSQYAVCDTLPTVPEYDLCREVVRCNERFGEDALRDDCKIRAFKNAASADVSTVSVAVALDELELATRAIEELGREKMEEFEEEFGPLSGQ